MIAAVLQRPFPTVRLQVKPSAFHPGAGQELTRLETRSLLGLPLAFQGKAGGCRPLVSPAWMEQGCRASPTARHPLERDIGAPGKDTGI